MQYKVSVEPVIPFTIGNKWNLITCTILPISYSKAPVTGGGTASGLGDTTQSFFFFAETTGLRRDYGRRPGISIYNSYRQYARRTKVGTGPTTVFLKQANGWT
jgi:hypothetical protein